MKVLIAEDDLYTRNALTAIFDGEGWEAVACADGRNALQCFKAGGFDLVCLDIMMPLLSGYDVCRSIRQTDRKVPVLFISAKSEEIDTVLGLELGADDFIVKPFGVRELQARVHAIMRRVTAADPIESTENSAGNDKTIRALLPFKFGPWEIRPAELRAWNGPVHLDLNARETAIVHLLASNPGRVVGRAEFFRNCWDLAEPPLSRTLDQYIARLRKKLENDPANPVLIGTVQGEGYRHDSSNIDRSFTDN